MNIFITGIAGFLGSYLADALIAKGHAVSGNDTLIGGYEDNIPNGATFYTYDCNDFNKLADVLKGVDIVYHCAATAYEGLSVFSPHLVTQNIVTATTGILSASIQNRAQRFIFCSSMARYGGQNVPFTEDMPAKPEDPYGLGKAASEEFVRQLCNIHGIEYVITVPHNIIGPRQKYDDPYRNVASIMINRMLQGKQPIIYGDGEQKRCFSFIHDDIQILEKLGDAKNITGEVINIGPDEEFITINELAKMIARIIGFDLQPIYVAGRPQEIKLATCSANKARALFDYKTHYTLEQGLREMVDWIKKRGVKPFAYHLPLEIINEKTPKTWTEKMI